MPPPLRLSAILVPATVLAGCGIGGLDYLTNGNHVGDTGDAQMETIDSPADRNDDGTGDVGATDEGDTEADTGSDAGPTFCNAPLTRPPAGVRWCDTLNAPFFCSDFDSPIPDGGEFYLAEGWTTVHTESGANTNLDTTTFFSMSQALRLDVTLSGYGGSGPKPSASAYYSKDFATTFKTLCVEFDYRVDKLIDDQISVVELDDASGARVYSLGLVTGSDSPKNIGFEVPGSPPYVALGTWSVPINTWIRARIVVEAATGTVGVSLIPEKQAPMVFPIVTLPIPAFAKFRTRLGAPYFQNVFPTSQSVKAWFDDYSVDIRK